MSYQSASGSLPNGNKKQEPKPLPDSAFTKITTPPKETIQKQPSYIIINNAGTYAFAYNLTGSIGASVPISSSASSMFSASYTTGSVMGGNQGNLKLDISPSAWANTADGKGGGSTGDITFVYRGK